MFWGQKDGGGELGPVWSVASEVKGAGGGEEVKMGILINAT